MHGGEAGHLPGPVVAGREQVVERGQQLPVGLLQQAEPLHPELVGGGVLGAVDAGRVDVGGDAVELLADGLIGRAERGRPRKVEATERGKAYIQYSSFE